MTACKAAMVLPILQVRLGTLPPPQPWQIATNTPLDGREPKCLDLLFLAPQLQPGLTSNILLCQGTGQLSDNPTQAIWQHSCDVLIGDMRGR